MRFETFSRQQRRVLTWWLAPETRGLEAVICDGAVRSGKTLCMGLSFFLWAMGCFDGAVFGLCGKTATALRRNLLDEVLPALGELGFQWEERVSRGRLRVRFGGRENTFYIFGGKDEGSAALIQGVTLAGVLLDEAALMPRSFVEQACARCSVPESRLWFSCNPEGLIVLCIIKIIKIDAGKRMRSGGLCGHKSVRWLSARNSAFQGG